MRKPRPVSSAFRSINMCLYGDPGVGKTPFACSGEDTLILDSDIEGTISAALLGSSAEVVEVSAHAELTEILELFQNDAQEIKKYKWVWWDGVSLFQESGLEDVMVDLKARKPHREIWAPDKGEYQVNMNRIMIFVRHMRALPVNFGVTAHTIFWMDKYGNELLMPWVQGKNMPAKVCGYMNIVARMRVVTKDKEGTKLKGFHNEIITRHTGRSYGKDQFQALGGRVLDPTVPMIEKMIGNKIPRKTTRRKKKTTRRRRSV